MQQQNIDLNTFLPQSYPLDNPTFYGKKAASAVQLDDSDVLLIGGYGDSKDSLATIHRVDVNAKSAVQIGQMGVARGDAAVAYYRVEDDERVFIFGGIRVFGFGSGKEVLTSSEILNPSSGVCEDYGLELPADLGKFGLFSVKLNDDLHLFAGGGKSFTECSDRIYVFDMKARRWIMLSSRLPVPLAYGAAAIQDGKVLFFGGVNLANGQVSNSIVAFTPSNTLVVLD